MTRFRIITVCLAACLALGLAACGSEDESVPSNAVAVVGDEAITKAKFDQLIDQAKTSYKTQKRAFPKAGTREYQALQGQAMQFLVQRAQFEQKAGELGIDVTDSDVQKRLVELKKQYFDGSEAKFKQQLKQQGLTEEQVEDDVRAQLIQEKLYNQVTKGVKITDKEIEATYKKNRQQYVQPASREVRHILVKKKELAESLYAQIQGGADFAALARQHSTDPSSKRQGGKLTISRGQTVPPFDRAAFSLGVNELSQPVKTQYGWHIIQPLGPVRKSRTTPIKQVNQAIRQQLQQERQQKKMTEWVNGVRKDFAKKTTYQVGYEPTQTGTTPAAQQ